jgi:GPI mannosyltransferase 3
MNVEKAGTAFAAKKRALTAIIGIAILLRIASAMTQSIHHTDEIGQYLDQAHRLVFGYGAETWEYRYGMRNYLIPLFLSGPMALGNLIAPDSTLYLLLPKIAVALSSLPILWAAFTIGRKISETHAVVALCAAAFWFEFIFFAGHILSEPMAVSAILPAAALLITGVNNRGRFFAAGFLFALGAVLRFHYAVPIAIIVFGLCWGQWRERLLPLVIGGLALLLLSAGADLAMGLVPFKWIYINIYQNIAQSRAASFGTSGPFGYFAGMRMWWGVIGLALILLLLLDVRRRDPAYAVLFWAAVVNLLIHSLIGHKEYRFIFLSTSIFVILAAIQSVDAWVWLRKRVPALENRFSITALCLTWIVVSGVLAGVQPMKFRWNANSGAMDLMALAGKTPDICGIALDENYYFSGSYTLLHRNIPAYITLTDTPRMMSAARPIDGSSAFNASIALLDKRKSFAPDYRPLACRAHIAEDEQGFRPETQQKICLFVRSGECNAQGFEPYQINAWLRANDL